MVFAGLIVLFLQRSQGEADPADAMWHYLVAAVGCALTNYLGNHGLHLAAIAVMAVTLGFIVRVMRPFGSWPRR